MVRRKGTRGFHVDRGSTAVECRHTEEWVWSLGSAIHTKDAEIPGQLLSNSALLLPTVPLG
jgi:hypothetical protein